MKVENKDNKGICRLAIVPVRSYPSETSEMVTQLLFGDHYTVLESMNAGRWLKVEINCDEYLGWIDTKQHYPISDSYFNHLNDVNFKICTDVSASLLFNKSPIQILIGSILPISSMELFDMEQQLAFNGESHNMGDSMPFEFVKQIAHKYLNAPYLWGGKTPFGVDCSGFTQMVFKIAGYKLPRDASEQALLGTKVAQLQDAIPGDLCFFGTKTKIVHVGMLLGDDKIIHASGQVRVDGISDQGIHLASTSALTHKLQVIKRVLRN